MVGPVVTDDNSARTHLGQGHLYQPPDRVYTGAQALAGLRLIPISEPFG